MTMDSKSFSSRFRRTGRKGNRAASPTSSSSGQSPATAAGRLGVDTADDDNNANNHHHHQSSPTSSTSTAHATAKATSTNAPPVLTITTTDNQTPSRPQTGNGNGSSGPSPSGFFRQPRSPFGKKFHFPGSRSSHKRARSPAPAALPQPTSPVLVKQDAMLDHEMMSPGQGAAATSPVQVNGGRPQGSDKRDQHEQQSPRVPAFLNMSEQGMSQSNLFSPSPRVTGELPMC